jgi:hypothetical protein
VQLGRRTRASFFGETGTLAYTTFASGTPRRSDNLKSFGGAITFNFWRGSVLGLAGSHTRFDSNLPGGGRTLDVLGFTVTLAAGRTAGGVP